ncbi:bacillithiol biosynthesis deacetylase BshB2 [Salimicrobium sp. PL1-032A]|uniref:bacillithiol biosynthesis deacetylase BshB2 n=1 Tax=Salimicrobium sp. PL1-032A TaxID=3095364 RepID=UPI003260F586
MIKNEKGVLVIFPHPDDEAFGVSGTISSYINQGTPVTYACLTLGEMGRNLGNPPFATRESLPAIRKHELQQAAKAMKLSDLRMMGYRDKTLEFEDEAKLQGLVTDLLDELSPSLVISFYPGFAVHPDHEATARAVVKAIREKKDGERPALYGLAFANDTEEKLGQPDIVHDITEVQEQKLDALKAHDSQTSQLLQDLEEGVRAGNPEALKWVTREQFYTYDWEDDSVN